MSSELQVLGIAQDGGLPHPGCLCDRCESVRRGERPRERVASVGLRSAGMTLLVDATPDLPSQAHDLTGGPPPDELWLTHLHLGHLLGLAYLGKEAWNVRDLPLRASASSLAFIERNEPWASLLRNGNCRPRPLTPGQVETFGAMKITPLQVPHRDEFGDTLAFLIAGPERLCLYCPDADRWTDWPGSDPAELDPAPDLLILDGTFSSARELPGRQLEEIPHPLIPATRDVFSGTRGELRFTHFNHSNAALDGLVDGVRDGDRFQL